MIILIFSFLQLVLFFFMTFHDWVHLPPLTDIRTLEKHSTTQGRLITSGIFALLIAIPLALTWGYKTSYPFWVLITICNFYVLLSLGTILSWWVPYFFESSEKHKADFIEYKNTHHFLPSRGDNVIPNTFHVILHLQIWACAGFGIYLLIKHL